MLRLTSSKGLESLVEDPLNSVLNRLVKHVGKRGDDSETKTDGRPGTEGLVLRVLEGLSRVLDDGVDSESGKSHRGETLENSSLDHHGLEILNRRNGGSTRRSLLLVLLVSLVRDISQKVEP